MHTQSAALSARWEGSPQYCSSGLDPTPSVCCNWQAARQAVYTDHYLRYIRQCATIFDSGRPSSDSAVLLQGPDPSMEGVERWLRMDRDFTV